jgi:Sec-independent protein translocase protein TatA
MTRRQTARKLARLQMDFFTDGSGQNLTEDLIEKRLESLTDEKVYMIDRVADIVELYPDSPLPKLVEKLMDELKKAKDGIENLKSEADNNANEGLKIAANSIQDLINIFESYISVIVGCGVIADRSMREPYYEAPVYPAEFMERVGGYTKTINESHKKCRELVFQIAEASGEPKKQDELMRDYFRCLSALQQAQDGNNNAFEEFYFKQNQKEKDEQNGENKSVETSPVAGNNVKETTQQRKENNESPTDNNGPNSKETANIEQPGTMVNDPDFNEANLLLDKWILSVIGAAGIWKNNQFMTLDQIEALNKVTQELNNIPIVPVKE